MSLRSYMRNFC